MQFLFELHNYVPPELAVFIMSAVPVTELRAALPLALEGYKIPLVKAFPIAVAGNMIPAFVILYLWDWFVGLAETYWPWLRRMMKKFEDKTQGKAQERIQKYGIWALVLFVAVPLPGSGVWTGSLAAWLFNLPKKKALLAIFVGALLSGVAVAFLTNTVTRVI